MKIYHKNCNVKKIEFCCEEMSECVLYGEPNTRCGCFEEGTGDAAFTDFSELVDTAKLPCPWCNAEIEIIEETT